VVVGHPAIDRAKAQEILLRSAEAATGAEITQVA
jgi:hypothetical protein